MSRKCVRGKTVDLRASVCLWCEGVATARAASDELEAIGYSVTTGVCDDCAREFHADSLRGTLWELRV